jgi:hypothetical protein
MRVPLLRLPESDPGFCDRKKNNAHVFATYILQNQFVRRYRVKVLKKVPDDALLSRRHFLPEAGKFEDAGGIGSCCLVNQ